LHEEADGSAFAAGDDEAINPREVVRGANFSSIAARPGYGVKVALIIALNGDHPD
jgi:hypothetical protein